jgi:hypothetical protein
METDKIKFNKMKKRGVKKHDDFQSTPYPINLKIKFPFYKSGSQLPYKPLLQSGGTNIRLGKDNALQSKYESVQRDSTGVQQKQFKPLAPTLKEKLNFPSIEERNAQQSLNQREENIDRTENRQIAKNVVRAGLETLPGTSTVANAYGLLENVAKGNYTDAASYGAGLGASLIPIPGAGKFASNVVKQGLKKFGQLGTANTAVGKSFNDYNTGGELKFRKLKFQQGGENNPTTFLKNKLKELYDSAGELTADEYAIKFNELNRELQRIDNTHQYKPLLTQEERNQTSTNTDRVSEPVGYQDYKYPNQPYMIDEKMDSNVPRIREGKPLTERLADKYAVKPEREPKIDMSVPRAKSKIASREPIIDKVGVSPFKFQTGGINIIPKGVLHKNRNNIPQELGFGGKGIPVVYCSTDGNCEKTAEIESNELILTKDNSTQLDRLVQKHKNGSASLQDIGNFFKQQLMANTHNNTKEFKSIRNGKTKIQK